MRRAFPIVLSACAVLTFAPRAAAGGAAGAASPPPCAGCKVAFPDEPSPPLLVVLHGDWGVGPSELVRAWSEHAQRRGVAVLALECPKELGCQGSWWRWNGDPGWLWMQVERLAMTRAIDRTRVWLAGWSGGASYIGMRAHELASFAALVYHGGGVAPSGGCPASPTPVYFLSGDKNPLQHLARDLRRYHETCNGSVTWQGLPGADHSLEWRALAIRGGAIVDWLLTKRRPQGTGSTPP